MDFGPDAAKMKANRGGKNDFCLIFLGKTGKITVRKYYNPLYNK